jgi:hypothetical protein
MAGKSQTSRRSARSAPPQGIGPGGAKLWCDVLGKYQLEPLELALLTEAGAHGGPAG